MIQTYFEWFKCLEKFSNGDDSQLDSILHGIFDVNSGTYMNFYKKVVETYKKRKEKWLEKFQSPLYHAKTQNEVAIYLRNAKMNLEVIHAFIHAEAFPSNLRKTLKDDIEFFVSEIKQTLIDNIKKVIS